MRAKPRPSVRPVLSERAERWIVGDLETPTYFAVARDEAEQAALIEVRTRLQDGQRRAAPLRAPSETAARQPLREG